MSLRSIRSKLFPLLLATAALALSGCPFAATDELVIYCAWDAVFSKKVIQDFERQTGIPVTIRFDTEATKSTGLVNRIIREANAPICDVFWNNETSGTIDLARRGLTEPYKGSGYQRIPDLYKDPEGLWCGFAARLRVWIINRKQMKATLEAVQDAFANNLKAFTYAKPMFGTTLTHCCVLWTKMGREDFIRYETRLRKNATVANGNGKTRDLVAGGTCAFGWTDTDDYFGAVDDGKPVAMLPVRVGEKNETICIPNSVAIIKGTNHRAQAEKLVDYLLSREVELQLANSGSRQIPLGPTGDAKLPPDVQKLAPLVKEGANLGKAVDARREVLEYLVGVYAN